MRLSWAMAFLLMCLAGWSAAGVANGGDFVNESGKPLTIAVIGTGRVGGALGPRFAELGMRVVYGSREPGRPDVRELVEKTGGNAIALSQLEAAQSADWAVLAVP